MCAPMQDSIYDAFAKAVTEKVAEFKQGSGMDPAVTLGPLINAAAVDRVTSSLTDSCMQYPTLCRLMFSIPTTGCHFPCPLSGQSSWTRIPKHKGFFL